MTDHSIIVNEIEKEYKQLEESNAWNQVYQKIALGMFSFDEITWCHGGN